jgi:acyl-CoA synthetase (AMP-forming)/AMP-acid ligase II
MTGESYAGMVRAVAARRPEVDALVFPDVRVSYRDLIERAQWRARELRALGLGAGDTFGVLLPNSPELIELMLGAAMIGAVTVPINTRYKVYELEHICSDGRLAALFLTAADEHVDFAELVHRTLPGLAESDPWSPAVHGFPHLRGVVLLGGGSAPGMITGAELRHRAAEHPAPGPQDAPAGEHPLIVMYTSGTTANAKGCITTNLALVRNAKAIAERFEIPEDDRWWDPLPMFHMGAILLMSAVFSRGGTFISQPSFEPDIAFDLIERHRATVLYPLFPTITLTLMHHPRFATSVPDTVRIVGNVSPPDVQRQIQAAFAPATLISAYGITELCGSLAYSRLDDTAEERTETCGHLLPGWDGRIVDPDTGLPVPAKVRGELVAKGPSMFAGYFGDPEQTALSIDAEGWFHTGDLCSMDEDGLLSFHGRLKDQLKVGGENVSALEVESFLATHPAIKLAAVVGVPDDRLIEVAAAFVELVPGESITEEEVVRFCTGQIARFKIPRYVRVVTEWPMSSTKVQKFRLRDRLLAELPERPVASTAGTGR